MIVIDDRLLFEVLSGMETAEFVTHASGGIATNVLVVLPAVKSDFDRTR